MRRFLFTTVFLATLIGASPAATHVPSSCATEDAARTKFTKELIVILERWRDEGVDRVNDVLDVMAREATVNLALMKCIRGVE